MEGTSSAAERPSPTEASKVAGRYVLLDTLGTGGMGSVHRARDEATGRIVAFKKLTTARTGAKQRTLQALFEREYHTLSRLKHPRIIEAYDYGLTETGPYYTMELLDGADLQQLAPLPYKEACRYLRDVASSLALIHAQRLVHRDVSPRNVRLTKDGRAKLIDFGALTPFGPAADVVGTPVCMAPEIVRRMPVDQRTDLYALGTVAYWALTGQHAFAARSFEDLPTLWQRPPVTPSKLVPGIPPGLDSLVLSLLSMDPLSRPTSAAAVIDQLTVHADLPPEEHEHAAESYLSSGRLVGREDEMRWMHRRVLRALEGRGAELLIEGATGVGKTRLMHEICLEAQLRGVVVLKADAQAVPGYFGVAATLAASLLDSCRTVARRTAVAHEQLLAHLSPELRDKLGQSELVPLTVDANERRARFQTALYAWFSEVAETQTVLLAVDNLHAADESSAAFLAALGLRARETKLVVLATQRSGDTVVAKGALRALRKRCSRLKLGGLTASACEELVQSLFGEVASTKRVARILYDKSAGNPQLCMDLAQLLVKKKIAKYVGGTWVLPLEVAADELPSRGEEILTSKLDGISTHARALAEALSIHEKPVPLELCLRVDAPDGERESLVGDHSRESLAGHRSRESLVDNRSRESLAGNRSRDSIVDNRSRDSLADNYSRDSLADNRSRESLASQREGETLVALDELVAEQVIVVDGASYRFAQQALRNAVLAGLPDARRRVLHARVASALLASGDDALAVRMEAAWHLLHAGEENRGADLLANTSRAFLKAQGATESVEHLVEALSTAVEIYERHGRSKHEIAALLFPMIPLGYFSANFRLLQTYALRAFELGFEITGLRLAHKLRRVLGKKLALKLGLLLAGLRFARLRKRGLELDLREAIAGLCGMVPAAMAAFSTSLDAQGVARLWSAIAPLSVFERGSFPALMYGWGRASAFSGRGRPYEAANAYAELLESFRGPNVRVVLGAGHFKSMYGGLLFTVAVMQSYGAKSTALELAKEMEGVGIRTWEMSADQVRLMYYAFRGEIDEVRRYRERVELFAVQGNATWQSELFLPAILLGADVLIGDAIAVRRTSEQLARRAKDVPSLRAYADVAHAAYLALRGELPAAIAAYERVMPEFPLANRVLWLAVRGFFGDALNQAGEHMRARDMLREALALLEAEDDAIVLSLESRRQFALAEAGLGNHAEAMHMLDQLIEIAGDNPLFVGLVHKARAELALKLSDKDAFEQHASAMEKLFRGTRNPALIAQCEQLSESAVRAGLRESLEPVPARTHAAWMRQASGQRTLEQLTAAADRGEYALWLILERSLAKSGYLYVLEHNGWRLAAASTRREPPAALEQELRALAERAAQSPQAHEGTATIALEEPDAGSAALIATPSSLSTPHSEDELRFSSPGTPARASLDPQADGDKTVFIDSMPAPGKRSEHQVLLLRMSRGDQHYIVGGVILELAQSELGRLGADLLGAVANALGDRCITTATESLSDYAG